jgi:preprotein translocase subunit SecF
MRIFSKTPNFDFVGIRKFALVLSLILFVGSIVTLTMNWLNLGLDFKGGILLEVGYPQEVKVETVRSTLSDNGFKDAVVKYIGSTNTIVTISISEQENTSKAQISNKVLEILKANSEGELEIRRREFVGAKVGAELRDDGGIAMLIAIAGILVYVMLRFEWRFAVGAITALVHDVFITLGFFSVFMELRFDGACCFTGSNRLLIE